MFNYFFAPHKETKWIGNGTESHCQNASALFEAISPEPKGFIETIAVTYYNQDLGNSDFLESKYWIAKDDIKFGRCFTFNPQSEEPIQGIFLTTHYKTRVFIHTPGNFFTLDTLDINLEMNKVQVIANLDYEAYDLLDYDGEPCQEGLDRDVCLDAYVHKVNTN